MALYLKQYCNSWAATPFVRLFTLYFRRKIRLLSGEKLFFSQQILLAENVVKGLAQNKFRPAYWYHLSLVTKNTIKIDFMKNSISTRTAQKYISDFRSKVTPGVIGQAVTRSSLEREV